MHLNNAERFWIYQNFRKFFSQDQYFKSFNVDILLSELKIILEAHMDDRPARRKFVFFKKFMSSFDFQPHIRVLVNALSLVRAVLSSICDRKL